MSAVIKYNAYEFSAAGRPHYSLSSQYEGVTPGGVRDRRVITYTVTHWFLEETFADNEARFRQLRLALKTTEGTLFIADENGTVLVNQRVRVATDDLPEQWGQALKEVRVTFTATEDLTASASPFDASFAPTDAAPIAFPNVSSFKESIRADRFSTAVPNRRETNGVATAAGALRADQADTPAGRQAYLLAQKALMEKAIDAKEGTFVYGDFSKVVKVDSIEVDVKDGTDELTWTISVSYRRFPAGDYAEADYEVGQSDDLEKQERVTSVRGLIRADDQAGAESKADAIRAEFAPGRILRKHDSNAKKLSGSDGSAFVELTFAYEFRELLGAVSYKLSISTRADLKSGQVLVSYSGTVQASSSGPALARARQLGDNKYPIQLSATETVGTSSVDNGATELLAEVAFSYEYLRKGTAQYAELTSEVDRETFGSSVQSLSGFAVAGTQADATTLARSFKPAGLLQRVDRESVETIRGADATTQTQFVKVTFNYTFHLAAIAGSIQYSKRTAEDYDSREVTTTWSGTAWAASEAAADGLISGLLTGAPGRKGVNDRSSNFDSGNQSAFISRTFTISRIATLAAGADDILQADFSVDSTYSVNATVLTPIPFGTPHVQSAVGITPGLRVASGSITALNLATAKAWARGKMPTGGFLEQPREKEQALFYPLSGTSVKAYRVEFSYGMRYANLTMA